VSERTTDDQRGPLPVAMVLAAVAGFLDAHIYLRVTEVFVANMSGNVVLLGMGVGQLDAPQVTGPVVAIVCFIAGIATATELHDRRRRAGRRLRPDLVIGAEAVVVATVMVMLWRLTEHGGVDSPRTLLLLAPAAFAMGVQTAVITRVGQTSIATTYESGAIARLVEESVGGWARHPAVRVLSAIVASYAGGAALAAAMGPSPWVLGVAVAALAATGTTMAALIRQPRS
jgi:uncharacterized membrane protein YoaK (UPF0700 family)